MLIRFFNSKIAAAMPTPLKVGIRAIFRQLTWPSRALRAKRRARAALRSGRAIWLEVGAGPRTGVNGWLTIDVNPRCDIPWDLRNGIPFPDATVSEIYSSHFLEHLTYGETQTFLDECLRVLRPGATFSVCVPNARLYLEAYLGVRDLDPKVFLRHAPAFNNSTKIDVVNYTAYMGGEHKYMWDEENLLHVLKTKGFSDVKLREFDPALDLQVRDYESIYAIATR